MDSIKEYLTADHGICDNAFALMEEKANQSTSEAIPFCEDFIAKAERHFQREERVMFEEFEAKTGMTQGPTMVMKLEHNQMRKLMQEMLESLKNGDKDGFFGNSETLMILLQQHNMKEEQMLYPLAQQHLSQESPRIVEMMDALIVE